MARVVNVEVLHIWDLATGFGSPQTGLSGSMTDTLNRYTATVETVASETVVIAEIDATGMYSITYTPAVEELYKGRIDESVNGYVFTFEDHVVSGMDVPSEANAYCVEADVDAFTQRGDYDGDSNPSQTELLFFMEGRAAKIYGVLRDAIGSQAPGPSGWDVVIDTTHDAGRAMLRATRITNALGAASDALLAAGTVDAPGQTEQGQVYYTMYLECLEALPMLAQAYDNGGAGRSARSATHVSEGYVIADSPAGNDPVTPLSKEDIAF